MPEDIKTQRLEKFAELNNMHTEDLLDKLKDWTNLTEVDQLGGNFTERDRLKALKSEHDVKARKSQTRSLSEFAGSSSKGEEDLSEREDEDIYVHYMEEMRKAKL